jgi:hypothetical protein
MRVYQFRHAGIVGIPEKGPEFLHFFGKCPSLRRTLNRRIFAVSRYQIGTPTGTLRQREDCLFAISVKATKFSYYDTIRSISKYFISPVTGQ